MSLDDATGDIEAKSYAASIAASHLPETLKDRLQHMGRYSLTCVVHGAA
jgi:hypothetical protein